MSYEAFTNALLTPTPTVAAAPTPAAVAVASGVSGGVGAVSAGGQAWVTADLKPGTYVIVCLIPDAKGVPHAALGMLNKITVR